MAGIPRRGLAGSGYGIVPSHGRHHPLPVRPRRRAGLDLATVHQVHRALGYKGLRYRVVNVRSLGERRRVNPAVRKLPVLGYGDALIPDSSFSAADLAVFAPLQLLAAPFTPPTAALVRRPGRRWNWMLRVDRATHSEHTAPLDGACPVA